jgi:hypothetical protein
VLKNEPDPWKNSILSGKPASRVKLEAGPNLITSRSRLKSAQNVVSDADLPNENLNIGAMCCNSKIIQWYPS